MRFSLITILVQRPDFVSFRNICFVNTRYGQVYANAHVMPMLTANISTNFRGNLMADSKIQVKSAKYTMVGEAVSHSRTDISVRDVKVITDEPLERDGTNVGASPTETMMAALVGCTNNVATRIAHHKKLNFEIQTIECDVEFDRRGVILAEPISVPFPNITITINVKTDATPEQLAEVEEMLPIYCPVSKVFREAGSNVVEKWNVID